jgi:hypothetical protein
MNRALPTGILVFFFFYLYFLSYVESNNLLVRADGSVCLSLFFFCIVVALTFYQKPILVRPERYRKDKHTHLLAWFSFTYFRFLLFFFEIETKLIQIFVQVRPLVVWSSAILHDGAYSSL